MSQRIFWNYQETLKSFDFAESFNGILCQGRFCGFDTKSSSGLALSLTHASTGVIQTDSAGVQTARTGLWVSRQGSFIQENATVSIGNVTANTSGNPRIDLILGDYLKPVSSAGSATYLIVAGTPASTPVAPAIPIPAHQVILGTLLVPDGTTANLTSCTFTPALVPLLGNEARPVYNIIRTLSTSNNWFGQDALATATDFNLMQNAVASKSFTFMYDAYNSTAASQVIATLPVDLRPSVPYYISVITSKLDLSVFAQSILKIATNGQITIANPANASDCFIYLKHLTVFIADTAV